MNRIEIRGIIVGSEYDSDWTQGYIERGILTPESYFRRALMAADPSQPLEVYINTPGGSVFAGNEMVNAAMQWKAANGQTVHVIIGAIAASMGASFAIQTSDTVAVHPNSLMMFHGAWGIQIGGSEAMQDYADLLERVNARDQTLLVSRYELQPEQVSEWYAEGREGWLDASEMKTVGIANEVLGEDAEGLTLSDDDVNTFAAHGLKVAALVTKLAELNTDEGGEGDDEKGKGGDNADNQSGNANQGGEGGEGDDAGSEEGAGTGAIDRGDQGGNDNGEGNSGEGDEGVSGESSEVTPVQITTAREEGRAQAVAEFADRVQALIAERDGLKAALSTMQSERDHARNDLKDQKKETESVREQLGSAQKRIEQLLDGSLKFEAGPQTWPEAVEECGGGEKGHVKASELYPELRKQYNAEQRAKYTD